MQPLHKQSTEEQPANGSFRKCEEQKNSDVIIPSDSILKSVTRSIECAVCLERLRIADNRVLPCQHTYHFGCLELTLAREGELRCPECRRLSDVDLEDLLPNYTLNKILESLPLDEHFSTPNLKRQYLRTQSLNPSNLILRNQQNDARQAEQPMPLCKAMYDYTAQHKTDLSFKKGDLIVLLRQLDEHWFLGEAANCHGTFPVNYVQVINPLVRPLCRALFNFQERHVKEMSLNSATNVCLYFLKNDAIDLMERIDQSWAKGKIGSRVGIFPLNFVAINSAARDVLNKWCRSNQRLDMLIDGKSSAGTGSWFYTNSSSDSTINRRPYSTNARKSRAMSLTSQSLVLSQSDQDYDDGTASLTPATYQSFSSILAGQQRTGRASTSRFSTLGSSKGHHTEMYIAKHDYCARREDELDLQTGKWYAVSQICSDGWYKGTSIETGKSGAFPGNFVFPAELNKSKSADSQTRWVSHQQTRRSVSTVDRMCVLSATDNQQSMLGLDEKARKLSLNCEPTEYDDARISLPPVDSQRWVTLSGYGYQEVHPTKLTNTQSSSLQHQSKAEELTETKKYVATLSYPPQNDTEVELVSGDDIIVHKHDPDGWLTGTVQRTGKTGLLPASFVKEIEDPPLVSSSHSTFL